MTKVTKEEVYKIARMSYLDVHEDEVESLRAQLEAVLSYAERVQEVVRDVKEPSNKSINVFREDVIVHTDVEVVLHQAPEREGNFFVVPAIIDHSKK